MLAIDKRVKNEVCPGCKIGNAVDVVGYESNGCGIDYMFHDKNVPVSMTWEIFGDNDDRRKISQALHLNYVEKKRFSFKKSSLHAKYMRTELATFEDPMECFAYFNPTKEEDYNREVASWTKGLTIFLEEVQKADLERSKNDLKTSNLKNSV